MTGLMHKLEPYIMASVWNSAKSHIEQNLGLLMFVFVLLLFWTRTYLSGIVAEFSHYMTFFSFK